MTDTVTEILALAENWAFGGHETSEDMGVRFGRFRAAIERVIRERDDAKMHDQASGIQWRAQYERAERAELQLTAAHQLQREHTVQLLRAEAERDAIKALLVEARAWLNDERMGTVHYMEGSGFWTDKQWWIARIDAAMEKK